MKANYSVSVFELLFVVAAPMITKSFDLYKKHKKQNITGGKWKYTVTSERVCCKGGRRKRKQMPWPTLSLLKLFVQEGLRFTKKSPEATKATKCYIYLNILQRKRIWKGMMYSSYSVSAVELMAVLPLGLCMYSIIETQV